MGGCQSTSDASKAKFKSDLIDQQIVEGQKKKKYKVECKMLLLGTSDSGKSTIAKQLKILYQNGFTLTELAEYRPIIYKNVLDSAQAIVIYMQKFGLECVEYENRVLAKKILDYKLDGAPGSSAINLYFSPEIAGAINQFWKDPIIPEVMDEHSNEFYLMDNATYFFSEVIRIGTPDYLPNESDVLRAKQKSLGIMETHLTVGSLSIRVVDVRQHSERKKWIHHFESVTSIIFCIALSDYDQVLLEDKAQNRIVESLILFESVVNSWLFLRTSIILFLNKIDVFKRKLPKVPLERYFPEYTGGPEINKAAKYILGRFEQVNRARLSIYPHLAQATDASNIRFIFAAIKETIIQNALRDSEIL